LVKLVARTTIAQSKWNEESWQHAKSGIERNLLHLLDSYWSLSFDYRPECVRLSNSKEIRLQLDNYLASIVSVTGMNTHHPFIRPWSPFRCQFPLKLKPGFDHFNGICDKTCGYSSGSSQNIIVPERRRRQWGTTHVLLPPFRLLFKRWDPG